MQRVEMIAGMTLSSLAASVNVEVPLDLRRAKGWVGQLLENVLGANAGNKPEPDFIDLGIELKTLPVDKNGKPTESTYVCVVPLSDTTGLRWNNSIVRAKMNHMLWLPIEADKQIPLGQRRVGAGIFWRPDVDTEVQLAADYNEFIERISLGEVESITADQGNWLQIRPKAANSSMLTEGIGEEGQSIRTLPRGFYLRPSFTRGIIEQWRSTSPEGGDK
ncbi:MAG: DNA mismatch repair endonuclease MutH [Gammaproteobacteria bacterium]|nr:MAG: DNA mismatch repair endonuclease MutH [Gammaproteobacteria bacterium]